jgi:hypothetical protein
VLQTWAIGPKRWVMRWISFSKKPRFSRSFAPSANSWCVMMLGFPSGPMDTKRRSLM